MKSKRILTINNLFSFKVLLILTLFLFLGSYSLNALEPPTKEQVERYKKDGTLKERIEKAKSFGNHKMAPHLIKRMKYKLGYKLLRSKGKADHDISEVMGPPPAWEGMPTTGDVKVLVVLVAFENLPPLGTRAEIEDKIFGDGEPSAFPYESVTNYYARSSYGRLNITGNVLGWYTADYLRSALGTDDEDRERLVKEILDYYNRQGHDFSQYDNDGDGDIDYFAVIWTGEPRDWSSFWWGYQTTFGDSGYTVDGKTLYTYSWQWESNIYPYGFFTPLVLIHETGHALGLPDLYDYEDSEGPDGGVGGLDMMDDNHGDHNCFSKFVLDWIDPYIISSGTETVMLGSSGSSGEALLVMPGADENTLFDEFFMVQNRFRENNDTRYPADGLLIWHVDARLDGAGYDFLYDNSYTDHKLMRLMEADGFEEIETSNSTADAGDFYTGGMEFGPGTTPDSNKYDGSESGVFVRNISAPGRQMTFTAGVGIPIGLDLQAERVEARAWIIRRYFGDIMISVGLTGNVSVDRYVLYRKIDNGEYRVIREIGAAEMQNSGYQYRYYDSYLEEDRGYTYRVIAYDILGRALITSNEVTI